MVQPRKFSLPWGLVLCAAITAATASRAAEAYEFQPIVAQLAPSGPASSRSFLLTNTQPGMIAVELQAYRRNHAEDGQEVRELDEEDFIIVPAQIVLPPNTSQTVNVQWVGEPVVDHELSYRLIAKQIPIDFKAVGQEGDAKVQLSLGYVYETALYITPPNAEPDLTLLKAEPATVDDARKLKLTFQSRGKTRAILEGARVRLKPAGADFIELSAKDLEGLSGRNFIAGSTQTVSFPWPESVPFGPVEASFEPDYLVMN